MLDAKNWSNDTTNAWHTHKYVASSVAAVLAGPKLLCLRSRKIASTTPRPKENALRPNALRVRLGPCHDRTWVDLARWWVDFRRVDFRGSWCSWRARNWGWISETTCWVNGGAPQPTAQRFENHARFSGWFGFGVSRIIKLQENEFGCVDFVFLCLVLKPLHPW